MALIVIGRSDVARVLTRARALELVTQAMHAISSGKASQLLRRIMPLPGSPGALGSMPGALGPGETFGLKSASIFPPAQTGKPSHQGFLLLFEPACGEPVAVIEAGLLTAIRTAAATALATRLLARTQARTLCILGAGEQAEHHLLALLEARDYQAVRVWARRHEEAERLVRLARGCGVFAATADTVRQAAEADIICTVTSAEQPILYGEWVGPGTHVNVVGSSSAFPREVDDDLVVRSRYFVDSAESARDQASEFLHALRRGHIEAKHLLGEIGQVSCGEIAGRLSDTDITVYKSLGNIAQDLACGWYLYECARAEGFGTVAEF